MKFTLPLIFLVTSFSAYAEGVAKAITILKIPYIERAGLHCDYADALLKLALDLSADKYGPYEVIQQSQQTVIRSHLLELEKGTDLSVATSMATPEWLSKAEHSALRTKK